MFKNPLKKYQQGGQVSQEQQQMLAAFVEWLPKRVQEFQGMKPEQIVEALNGMTKSPEGQKQVQAYMQQFQQEMQNSQAGMFENGGKLQDFICKHAKGGHVAGCGCKEDGGKVEKHQQDKGKGRGTIAEQDGFSVGKKYWTNNADGSTQSDQYAVRPNGVTVRQRIVDRSHMLDRDRLPVRDTVNVIGFMQDNGVFAPDYDAEVIYGAHPYFQNNAWSTVRREEDGGVVKGQEGLNIPAEPPTGYNGEIRQYIDRRNPIRRRIDIFVENNPYARKIVSLGKGIKESPLGMLLPDFSNGVAGAVAPVGKISKISNLNKKSKSAMDRILSGGYREYREDPFKAGMPDNFTGTYSRSTERPFGLSDDPFGFYNDGGVIKQNTKK